MGHIPKCKIQNQKERRKNNKTKLSELGLGKNFLDTITKAMIHNRDKDWTSSKLNTSLQKTLLKEWENKPQPGRNICILYI